jgi:hypothetical protein
MAYVLTFCLTLAAGLLLLVFFRSHSKLEEGAKETARQEGGRGALHPQEERATEIAETLAIEKANDAAVPVLRAGTLLPAAYAESFRTVDDGQRAIQLRLLLGGSKRASECRTLLRLTVPLVHPGPPGKPNVKLVLDVGEDGTLAILADEKGVSRPVGPADLRIPVKASDRKRTRWWPLLRFQPLAAGAASAFYFGYVLYSDIDQSGLTGWIASLSMRLFHASWDIPNVLLGWALYFPGAGLLRRVLFFTMPGLAAASLARKPVPPARRSPVTPAHAPRTSSLEGRRKSPLLIVAVGIAMFVGTFGGLVGAVALASWSMAEERRAFAPELNLNTFSGTPPTSPRLNLEGWLHEQLAARYESAWGPDKPRLGATYRRDHAFIPVTSTHWKPGEPVSVLLETTGAEERDDTWLLGRSIHWKPGGDPGSVVGQRTSDAAFAPNGTTLNVRLRKNDLPYFVKDAYERAEMRFTNPYWVADTDDDVRPFALALVGWFLVTVFGLTFLVQRLRAP